MRKTKVGFLSLILGVGLFVGVCTSALGAGSRVGRSEPPVSAVSAVLMDEATGKVLWSRNPDTKREPASTTKILTAIVAIEKGNPKKRVTVSPDAARVEGSSMYLSAGERLTEEELLYGAMLSSGNDACIALAESVSGSTAGFVKEMNDMAKRIGAESSSFNNPNGLPDPKHYTTARDLALIARYGLGNPKFRGIVATRDVRVSPTPKGVERNLVNHNKLLWRYAGADGIKTGYTVSAGKCLVGSATRGGQQLIAVILGSSNIWSDSVAMLDYGFNNYALVKGAKKGDVLKTVQGIKGGDGTPLRLACDRDLRAVVDRSSDKGLKQIVKVQGGRTAPVRKGETLGVVELTGSDGTILDSGKLVAVNHIDVQPKAKAVWTALLQVIRIFS